MNIETAEELRARAMAPLEKEEKKRRKVVTPRNEIKDSTGKQAVEFDVSLLPVNAKGWAEDVAIRMDEAPVSFAGTAALETLSTAIGRKVGVRPKLRDHWTVIPNLWGMLIAPPGVKKSPIFDEMISPLKKAEMDAYQAYEEELQKYQAERMVYGIELKEYKNKLKAKKEVTPLEEPTPPVRRRFLLQDATVEKVAEIMRENPNGVGVFIDELAGWFRVMNKGGREGDLSFWLEAKNGNGSISVDRIGRGSLVVPHVCATVFGTIQPDALLDLVASTLKQSAGGNGLLQRFQMIAFEEKARFRFTDRSPNLFHREAYKELIKTLTDADPLDYGAKYDDYTGQAFFQFSPEAAHLFADFAKATKKEVFSLQEYNPAFAAHLNKFDDFLASLALILFYSDRVMNLMNGDTIPAPYVERAWKLIDYYKAQALRVYDLESLRERKEEALEEKIHAKIKELLNQGEEPTIRRVVQLVRGANTKDVERAVRGFATIKGRRIVALIEGAW